MPKLDEPLSLTLSFMDGTVNNKKIACLLELSSKFDASDFTSKATKDSPVFVATMMKNIEDLGFTFSKKLFTKLGEIGSKELVSIYETIVPILKKMKGANVRHKPMYPNFPGEVMGASDALLYVNAMVHYIGVLFGENILPDSEKKERFPLIGNYNLKVIDLAGKNEYAKAINDLMTASIAISPTQKKYVEEFYVADKKNFEIPVIKNKENLAFVAGFLYADKNIGSLSGLLKTPTDLLRFITALNAGDVSLAANTKFKSMKRSERKMILVLLEGMKSLSENMVKYKLKWIRLGEILHPGEFSKRFPKAFVAFRNLRQDQVIETFNSKVEKLISDGQIMTAANLLSERPTDLARRLDHLLRLSKGKTEIIKVFKSVAADVTTSVLLNIRSHFEVRHDAKDTRMFFPKGSVAKAKVIENALPAIKKEYCEEIVDIITKVLVKRFADSKELGNVFIDDSLKTINVPFALRSASRSFKTIARGSRVAVGKDKNVIRLFTYWKNGTVDGTKGEYGGSRIDIDLTSMFLDADFNDAGHTSWTRLSNNDMSAHSGDITDAPRGASEFIDIDIKKALAQGIRYVAMNIYSFTGQNFDVMNECFAGCMLRDDLRSGEIFDPKTVEHKYDLTSASTCSVPMIFDLVERQLIWLDLTVNRNSAFAPMIEGNKVSMAKIVQGIVEMTKPNLHDLLSMHAKGRGKIVKDRKNADKVYDMEYALNSLPEILTLI